MKYIKNYYNFYYKSDQTNESMKNWLSSFLLMANLGLVPISLKAENPQTKKEFIESQPQDKMDAIQFYDYLQKFGLGKPLESVWSKFIEQKSGSIQSSLEDVKKYISQDGRNYYFENDYAVHDFSNVNINDFHPSNYLTDMGNFIPDNLEPTINNWISDYEQKTSIEIGIITIQSLGDNTIEQYATNQFNRLGIGKSGADNGILLVFSMDDRKSRIETGYGIEEFLPDATCNDILMDIIRPHFRDGDYYGGIMGALESMRKYMGDEAYEEKVRWLKEKKEKEDRESAEWWSSFWDNFMMCLLISLILGSIGYVVYRGKKAKQIKLDIKNATRMITDLINQYPKSISTNSKYLKSQLLKLKSKMDEVESTLKDIKSDKKSKNADILEKLNDLRSMADDSINRYKSSVSDFNAKVSDIKKLDSITKDAFSTVDKAIQSYKKISDYGYQPPNTPQRSEIDALIPLALLASSILLSNTDEAIENADKFRSKIGEVINRGNKVIDTLSSIESAKSNFQNRDSMISSKIREMDSYKSWAKGGERESVENKIKQFKFETSNLGPNPDYLKENSRLSKLISEIEEMKSKWYSRKRAHEEEEERKRREKRRREEEEEARRRRSYSSSSYGGGGGGFGGGGFGGFGGGGRSGGGGASGSF